MTIVRQKSKLKPEPPRRKNYRRHSEARPFSPPWAETIVVEQTGDTLQIAGAGHFEKPSNATGHPDWSKRDPIRQYLEASRLSAEDNTALRAPHVRFSNADSEDLLIQFVSEFGPVWGSWPARRRSNVFAIESLQGLAKERAIFAAGIRLSGSLVEASIEGTATAMGDLVEALYTRGAPWEYEEYGDRGPDGHHYSQDLTAHFEQMVEWQKPGRKDDAALREFGESLPVFCRRQSGATVLQLGSQMFCALLNVSHFRPEMVFDRGRFVELPARSRRGLLPALYFMLRSDVLRKQSILVCELSDCGNFFRVERYGQRFCSPNCSQRKRLREYWQRNKDEFSRRRKLKRAQTRRA
jgi:hypothetical protein